MKVRIPWRRQRPAIGFWLSRIAVSPAAAICLSIGASAQTSTFRADPWYLIDSWETEDGLPENSATAMVQTRDGYLWFGTFNGLTRFDGVEFSVLNPANTPALPSRGIVNLHLDRKSRLWVSTLKGLAVLEGRRWRAFGAKEGWTGDYVRTFAERPDANLLITTFDGKVFEFAQDRLAELPSPPGHPNQGYFASVDEDGRWWLTQNGFVGRWDGRRWESVVIPGSSVGSSDVASVTARSGGPWILLGKELLKLERGQVKTTIPLPQLRGGIWGLNEDSRGNVWISSYDSGLFRVSPAGDLYRWNINNGLGYHASRFVFEDREQNLWVGSSGGGLRRFKPRRFSEMGVNALSGRVVRSVWPARTGGVWVASYDTGLFHCFDREALRVSVPGPVNESNYGLSVLEDRNGNLWYSDSDHLWRRRDQSPFDKVPFAQPGSTRTGTLFEDSEGRIWAAIQQGATVWDGDQSTLMGPGSGLPPGEVFCFAEDSHGHVWLAGEQGVFRHGGERFARIIGPAGPPHSEVLCLHPGSHGTMWLGTREDGLWRWRNGSLSQAGAQARIPAQAVHAILDDGLGYFWMPSNRGIVRAAERDLEQAADGSFRNLPYQHFDHRDGLPTGECPTGQPSCARDESGRLWFATQKGLAMVDPANLQLNTLPPPLCIETLTYHAENAATASEDIASGGALAGRIVRLQAPFAQPLALPAGRRRVELHYAALSFTSPEKIRYQTRLDGISRDWEEAHGQRLARFYELPPGDYVFRVRAANNDGVWNESGASLAFTVLPFFWQTFWFRSGVAVLLLVAGGVSAWWRAHRRHRRQIEDMERTRRHQAELAHSGRVTLLGQLASALAHELSQPLAAILRNAEAAELMLQNHPPDLEELRAIVADIHKDDQRASDVIDRLRSLLKRRTLDSQPVDLPGLTAGVIALVSSDATSRGVTLAFPSPPELPLVLGDRVHLQQVLLNLIVNAMDAMKEPSLGERRVGIEIQETASGMAEIRVSDTGSGIPPDSLNRLFEPFYTTKSNGLGMGLPVSKTIIEAHQGSIWAENRPEGGAVFRFTVPIARQGGVP